MIKKHLYDLLENHELTNGRKYFFDIFLAVVILVSIVFIFLENKHGELPKHIEILDNGITLFFIIEFLARFYVCSNFRLDVKNQSIGFALMQKVRWFFTLSTMIDFLAIIPSVKFFRIFRTLRFLRLFRIFKAYRSIKAFRDIDKIFTVLKGMKEESRGFYIFISFTTFFILLISFALYMSESNHPKTEFANFGDSIWYSIKVIGFGDDTPKTGIGKFFAGMLLLTNMAIFGFFITIIHDKIQKFMAAVSTGKIGKLKLTNHIVICGYTKSSIKVIKNLLADRANVNNIVLVTKKDMDEDIAGIIYVNADFTERKTFQDLNITKAKNAIVFAETHEHDAAKDVDLRTVITIFNIEKAAPNVHIVAEINDEQNAEIIKDRIEGDEILYKENLDAKIISSCITHKHISTLFYKMFDTTDGEKLAETNISTIGLGNQTQVKAVKLYFVEKDATFLGYIDSDNNSYISPKNNTQITANDRLIYLKN